MKIYTRKGDSGETGLLGGTRVPKHHLRIEAYGTVDELNSWIGLLRDQGVSDAQRALLLEVQDRLFTMGSILALDPSHQSKMILPQLHASDVQVLEDAMDAMDEHLPEMRSFVLPGGHPLVSQCHIARCVCRRAERMVTALHEQEPLPEIALTYLNRLSDYLFVLSRALVMTTGGTETPWKPRV
jgi:cob(I)alamin adenosyltransferase